jgi:hypothetical protein
MDSKLQELVNIRLSRLEESHSKIRTSIKLGKVKVEPKLPADIVGVYVLVPIPTGVEQ